MPAFDDFHAFLNVVWFTGYGVINTQLTMKQMASECHSLKWNMIIAGIEGGIGETDTATRQLLNDFNRKVL